MNSEQLLEIYGGAGLNGTLINALVRAATTIYELARALGSALRRTKNGNYCPN